MGDSAKKENDPIRFDSLQARWYRLRCDRGQRATSELPPQSTPGVLESRLWTLVLMLLVQSTEAMTGRTALQQTELVIAFVEATSSDIDANEP